MLPSLFLAHGSPLLALEDTGYTRFLNELGKQFSPKAIIIFTAHWESEQLTISAVDGPYEMIYDFYGFPEELYKITYPAKGSAELAESLKNRFDEEGTGANLDKSRGLDHGSWTLLYKMYPKADIPVVQVSVNPFLAPDRQYQIGKILKSFKKEDILIIASGVTVHNLRMVNWNQKETEQWAIDFDDWLINHLNTQDLISLFQYEHLAPHAKQAVPRPDHFVPFFIAMGSGDIQNAKVIHRSYDLGTLSYLCFQF